MSLTNLIEKQILNFMYLLIHPLFILFNSHVGSELKKNNI